MSLEWTGYETFLKIIRKWPNRVCRENNEPPHKYLIRMVKIFRTPIFLQKNIASVKICWIFFYNQILNILDPLKWKDFPNNPSTYCHIDQTSPTDFFLLLQQITFSIMIWNSKKIRGSSTFLAHFIDMLRRMCAARGPYLLKLF